MDQKTEKQQEKINGSKSSFFENNEINELSQIDQEKRKETQIINTRNDKRDIIEGLKNIKRIKEYYGRLHGINVTTQIKWINSLKNTTKGH